MSKNANDPRGGVLVLRKPAQLRALRDPVRARIMRCLENHGPAPVSEVAEHLRRSPESLYYHVRALVAAGFLEARGKQPSGRRHHTVYGVTYSELRIDPEQRGPGFFRALLDHYLSRLRRTERDVERSLERDRKLKPTQPRRTGLLQLEVRLSEQGLLRFRERAMEWLDELESEEDATAELMGITIAFAGLDLED